MNHGKKEILAVRLRVIKQQKKEAERKVRILAKLNDFVHRARSLGLEESGWDFYEVYIDEPVTFFELEQMLNQCTNSPAYYFKPVSLHAKAGPGAKPDNRTRPEFTSNIEEKSVVDKKTAPVTPAGSREAQKGDVLLTLKGAFVVRR